MDILDALEEIKDHNTRAANVDVDSIINRIAREGEDVRAQTLQSIEEQDEAAVKAAFSVCSYQTSHF